MTHERDSSPHAETESAASFSLAIVGMAGRFPGAHNVDQYWQNLLGGVKSIRHFSQPELLAAGTGTQILREPNFVPAGTLLDGMDRFDAAFFGLTPREAETMDPQTRLFLQAAWETLEDAGYAPGHYPGLVGVFAGKAFPRYFTSNLLPHPDLMRRFGELQVGLGMERDTLAPLVAYKLDLKGPSVSVGTFCSTSLVAVHLACQSLLAFECDLALAGGVHLEVPQGRGYLHVDGGILSLDGECRALDARGSGSVMGNGLGVVAIKRLEDALASGDQIYAVIRGTAANNDGRDRVGFTAPGVNGQAAVIAAALANAGVEARSISYVETHGTGTALGDSVELAAMRRVFQQNTDACHFCALGSVKPNIGHLDRAAGVASLIKAALALKHRTLPPSLNYEQPNAELALEESPFCVNSELRAWPESVSGPRRAGVSSFGLGGTNAHVVLEEPPELVSSAASRTHHLLVLSARSEAALEQATDNLIDHLEAHPEQDLADVAYTLQVGRAVFPHRRMAVVRDRAEALAVLRSAPAVKQTERDTPVVFVCGDSEGTRVGDLYASELVYRDAVDRCGPSQWMARASSDARTFVAEYALAELLRAWGVEPAAAEGNGVGALVAAVIEGRLALEEALPHALGEVIELGAELPHRTIADTVAAVRQVRVEITPTDLVGALDLLGQLWLGGARVDWSGFHRDEQRRRVSLPTYPFEERRFWIDPPPNMPVLTTGQHRGKKADPGEWGYAPVWTRVELPEPSPVDSRPWLIFADAAGVAASIADARAQAGLGPSLLVRHGQRFAEELDGVFTVRPNHAADYHALIRTLDERELLPGKVVHLWSLDANANSKDRFEHAQQLGFYSLISLIQSMGERAASAALELVAVSDGAQAVASDQDVRNPEQATMRGACISIAQESVTIRCRSIDLDAPSGADNVRLLLAELLADSPHLEVAYRQGVRYTLSYAPQRLERPSQPVFRQGGTYLLLGGFGGVGTVLAEHLARTASANLVLVGRSALTSEKRDIVAKLEALGGHVMVESADIADTSALRRVIQHTQEQFGALHGVFHLATISDRSAYDGVHAISRAQCQRQFGPKAQGAIALADALADLSLDLDFCVLFSSLASVLGGLSFAAYTAANIFLDAFAVGRAGWHSIDWDTWQVHPEAHVLVGGTVAEYEMAPPEGLDVLERVLAGSTSRPRTVISTGDLDARVRQWIDLESLRSPSNCSAVSGGGARPDLPTAYTPASSDVERQIAGVWRDALGIDPIGIYDNFFDLGGNSLVALQVIAGLKTQLNVPIPVVALFEAPTVSALARYLQPEATAPVDDQRQMLDARRRQARGTPGDQPLAIIGMAGRFPGARDTDEFWSNLRQGVESIATFSDDELAAAGVPHTLLANPNYIKARPIIDGPDLFDAGFFGYNPREAELTDPQHRLFLECAWQSLESAGYDPKSYPGLVGVFGGTNISTYMLAMASDPDLVRSLGTYEASYQLPVGNDKDALATAVSYKLNLRGPSLTVQTFCSTSLVAVHLACQSLRRGECDLALAGGVSVRVPTRAGYLSVEGGMESPDGHCRTFDTRAQGTLFGDGLGIVVLKRLDDAVVDGDTIYGVVRGSAMNNDGSVKVGYAAPSLDGQADVIQAALEDAGVSADTIEYVEAHGTATPIGDPIEVAALTRAFRHHTSRVGTIALGSVKTNVGHLDRAAGVSGLIKTVLALHHGEIPPSLHFESPNPELDLEHSPFFVNTNLRPWARNGHPRRAGVNSLGMGGTNVHVVLEEAPDPAAAGASRPHQLLLLSARTESALEVATDNLVTFLREHPDTDLADVAYTLQVGRARFEHRRALVCEDRDGALQALGSRDGRCLLGQAQSRTERPIAFMFPGLGDQYVDMARELYEREPVFRDELDRCFSYVQNQLDLDLKAILFSRTDESKDVRPRAGGGKLDLRAMLGREGAPSALSQTAVAQPAVFVVEYALARLLMAWGIRPRAMVGYSLGEYVAACLAGVLSLEEALTLVLRRAQLIQAQPGGAMLAVALSAEDVAGYLHADLSLAGVNGPTMSVVSGTPAAVAELERHLETHAIVGRRLQTTHAFHSFMMDPVAAEIERLVASFKLSPPRIPYVSNVTGTWITPEQATSPAYWAAHVRQPVQFGSGVSELLRDQEQVLLEVGPGRMLGSIAKLHPECVPNRAQLVLPTLRHTYETQSDTAFLLQTLARLWLAGAAIDWSGYYRDERRQRRALPGYPFERQRYWLEPRRTPTASADPAAPTSIEEMLGAEEPLIDDVSNWFFAPSWQRLTPLPRITDAALRERSERWLLFVDACGVGNRIASTLHTAGHLVTVVQPGPVFSRVGPGAYTLRADERADYDRLLRSMDSDGGMPTRIVHLWSVGPPGDELHLTARQAQTTLTYGFYSLLALIQAYGDLAIAPCAIDIVSSDVQDVLDDQLRVHPARATVLGAYKVIPQEYPQVRCKSIDVSLPAPGSPEVAELIDRLLAELLTRQHGLVLALRGRSRWRQTFVPNPLSPVEGGAVFRERGVYLITGGLGGIGLGIAERLAREYRAQLVLVSRSGLTPDKLECVQRLEQLGGDVLVLAADVADVDQMRAVVDQTLARYGCLHGVIHAAGRPAVGLTPFKDPLRVADVMAPKVLGTLALHEVLGNLPLDFLLLFGSMASITGGGPGQIEYCAANAFLDAFARRHHNAHGCTLAVDWGEWQWDAWQAGLEGYPPEARAYFVARRQRFGISLDDGFDAMRRVLGHRLPQLVVSTQDFVKLTSSLKEFSAATVLDEVRKLQGGRERHARPNLGTSYATPRDDLEKKIAHVWGELLGLADVGIDDNFFELGGNSLIGVDLIMRLRRDLGVRDLPIHVLYEAPTVGQMARRLRQTREASTVVADEQARGARRLHSLRAMRASDRTR